MRVTACAARAASVLLSGLVAGCAASGIAGCAASGVAATDSATPRVVAAENVWGSIAAQLAGPDATVTSIISDPAHRSPLLRADRRRRPAGLGRPARDRQRPRLRPLGLAARRGRPRRRIASPWTSAQSCTCTPAITRTAGTTRPTSTTVAHDDHKRPHARRPGPRAAYVARLAAFEHQALAPVSRRDRPDPPRLRRRPGRRLGEHLRAAGARARPRPAHPARAS